MTPDDLPMFSARLVTIGELFDAVLSESKQWLYFDALRDLPLDAVLAALGQTTRTCTFMPKPAEIRQLLAPGGDPELAVEAAWLQYKHLAARHGGYASVTFDDPALADTLLAMFGSWEAACWSDFSPEMWAAKRKEFGRVYRVMLERGQRAPKTLDGFCDRTNLERYGVAAPVHATLPAATGIEKLLAPAVMTIDCDVFSAREAQRATWRANVRTAIEAAASAGHKETA